MMMTRQIFAIFALSISGAALSAERPAIADQVAATYGFGSFDRIDAIRYTFNVDAGPRKVSRSWIWEPKANQVTYEGKDKEGKPVKVTYSRAQVASGSPLLREVADPGFINDQYWLLFPFHLVWDSGPAIADEGMQKLPLGKGKGRKVSVKYSSNLGYTPGDTWDLYLGADGRVKEFAFHHGGEAKPKVVLATWAGYKKAGPLLIATDHRGKADGNPVRIFFTGVAVKLSGSNDWLEAR